MYSIIAAISFVSLLGYFLFNYYNSKKDNDLFKNLEIDFIIAKETFESKLKKLETDNFKVIEEFINKIEYLKNEIKNNIDLIKEYELLLQKLTNADVVAPIITSKPEVIEIVDTEAPLKKTKTIRKK